MIKKSNLKGFTLIELLVVIAIIGILGAIVYAPFQTARRKGRDAQKIVEMKNIYSALLLYADSHNGRFPTNLYVLQQNQPADKLPANSNVGTSPTDRPALNMNKYNYTSYVNSGEVVGFHLYTHLETNSPALTGTAACYGYGNSTSSCAIGATGVHTDSQIEAVNGTEAFFTDRTQDTDELCATDVSKCVYDIRG